VLELTRAYGLDFLVPASDSGVGRALREAGEFARPELDLILETCDGDFLDVGANVGAIALPFAAQRPQARVVAVEAHRTIAHILAANALTNHLLNVEVFNVVAGEQAGLIEVPMPPLEALENVGAASLYARHPAMERIRMATLDELAPPAVRFVKVDVEGFEPRVLQGAARLLNEVRPAWLVEAARDRPNAVAKTRAALSAAGYRLYWFFSPFVTALAPKPAFAPRPLRGDVAFYACDGEPPWPMNPVGEAWPEDVADFPYLSRYGLTSARIAG
jgi:FkbM family methyltransferase